MTMRLKNNNVNELQGFFFRNGVVIPRYLILVFASYKGAKNKNKNRFVIGSVMRSSRVLRYCN